MGHLVELDVKYKEDLERDLLHCGWDKDQFTVEEIDGRVKFSILSESQEDVDYINQLVFEVQFSGCNQPKQTNLGGDGIAMTMGIGAVI